MRLLRILIALLLFSFLYYGIDLINDGEIVELEDILKATLRTGYWHLWYLYRYVAFLVTLPFLRKLVKGLDELSSAYMLVIAILVMGFVPIFEYFISNISGNWEPSWLISNIFIYPVAGYVIDSLFDIKQIPLKHMAGLWITNLICFAISGVCEYNLLIEEPKSLSEVFITGFSLLNAVTLFATIKYFMVKREYNNVIYSMVTETGKCTFGIYLTHIWFLWQIPFFYEIWEKIEQGSALGQKMGVFLTCILVFGICGIITYVIRKIPVVRKLF